MKITIELDDCEIYNLVTAIQGYKLNYYGFARLVLGEGNRPLDDLEEKLKDTDAYRYRDMINTLKEIAREDPKEVKEAQDMRRATASNFLKKLFERNS